VKKDLKYDFQSVQNELALEIASLKIQLANEKAAKQAIIKYAEELEKELEELRRD